MNLLRPELLDRLAAEYVLGTLRLGARRRFERLLRDSPAAMEAVLYWQQRLLPLAERSGEQKPPEAVWQAIEKRLFAESARALSGASRTAFEPWWRRLIVWQGAAVLSSVCAAWFGIQLLRAPTSQPLPSLASTAYVIALNNSGGEQTALVSVQKATLAAPTFLSVSIISPPTLGASQVLELWSIPQQAGAAPRSLGLLPLQGSVRLPLNDPALIEAAAALAVSIEPAGGSKTGLPTGPVILQGKIVKL